MQPHIHRGRFFNHAHERLSDRLYKEISSLTHLVIKRLTRKTARVVNYQQAPHEWIALEKMLISSYIPVVTWLGHATFLIQLNNINILTDPVFDEVSRFFPRITKLPISLHELPKIDVVVISHNHRDHMDKPSLLALQKDQPLILVPLGNKPWFVKHGFENIVEMNWWEQYEVKQANVQFTFLPANHWTGRGLFDVNKTLWGSWMIQISNFVLYFAGDTAYGQHFTYIGQKFSSIDAALMPIGPNEPRTVMIHSHVSTEQAIQAFIDLKARFFIPMHWGTFKSGLDLFADPIDQLYLLWDKFDLAQEQLHALKFGEQRSFQSSKSCL